MPTPRSTLIVDADRPLLALIAHGRAAATARRLLSVAMRAAVMTNWELRVDDIDEPTPSDGQVLTKVLACGICGSDLHLVKHGEESRRLSEEMAGDDRPIPPTRWRPNMFEPSGNLVMGHEFCCEVVEVGPGVNNLAVGDVVVSMPVTFDAERRPRDRVLEHLSGRLRRADGAQRDAGDQGARPGSPTAWRR